MLFFSNGILGVTEPYILTSAGIGVVAYILALISDFLDYTTSSSTKESKFDFIGIAKYISGACVGIVVLFYVYIYVICNLF